MKGFNDDELVDFVEWTREKPVEVRFIEWMPFGGNSWNDKKFISVLLQTAASATPVCVNINAPAPTVRRYAVNNQN